MAENQDDPTAGEKPKKKRNLGLILPLINTLAILGVLGLFVYTRVLYKRPPITETSERARLEELAQNPTPPPARGLVTFEEFLASIAPANEDSRAPSDEPKPVRGNLNSVSLGFVVEIRDESHQAKVDAVKPLITDQIIKLLGTKKYQDLNHVQGRYILKAEILDLVNQVTAGTFDKAPRQRIATAVHFTNFVVQ